MRALITGITGFIGGHLAEHLLNSEDRVLGVSRTGTWPPEVHVELSRRCSLFAWDLARPCPAETAEAIVQFQPDVVFHLGGISDPRTCGLDRLTPHAHEVNIGGTRRVLDLIEHLTDATNSPPRLIFTSSCHVYSADRVEPYFDETGIIAPRTPYGQSKRGAELAIMDFLRRTAAVPGTAKHFEACIVRVFHLMGPRQPAGRMLSDWISQLGRAANGEPPPTLKIRNDHAYLDLLDVRDAVVALRQLAIIGLEEVTPVYNLGSGIARKSGQILNVLLEIAKQKPQIEVESVQEIWNPIAIIDKLLSTGWRRSHDDVQTLRDMWESATYSGK